MTADLGSLFFRLGLDKSGFRQDLTESERELKAFQQRVTSIGIGIASALGVSLSIGGAMKLIGQAQREFQEYEQASQSLNQVLRGLGETAIYSRDSLERMATEFSRLSRFEDDSVMAAESVLLRFEEMNSSIFPEALKATIDLAEAMGGGAGSLENAAVKIGRALENPQAGLRALSEFGVAADKKTRDLIKSFIDMGDVMSAQRVLIDELNRSVGGRAQEAMEGSIGATNRLKKAWAEMLEGMGQGRMARGVDRIKGWLADIIEYNTNMSKAEKMVREQGVGFTEAWSRVTGEFMSPQQEERAKQFNETLRKMHENIERGAQKYEQQSKASEKVLEVQKRRLAMEQNITAELMKQGMVPFKVDTMNDSGLEAAAKRQQEAISKIIKDSRESSIINLGDLSAQWQEVPDLIIISADNMRKFNEQAQRAGEFAGAISTAFMEAAFAGKRWLDVLLGYIKSFVTQAIAEFVRMKVANWFRSTLPGFSGTQNAEGAIIGGSINKGGGMLGGTSALPGGLLQSSASPGATVNIIDQREAGSPPVSVSESTAGDGSKVIDVIIESSFRNALNSGRLDGDFARTYRLSRVGRAA